LKQLFEYFSVIQQHSDMKYDQGNKYLRIFSKGRREGCLKVPKLNTTTFQNYYQYWAIPMYNEFPMDIKLINDKEMFKSKAKNIC